MIRSSELDVVWVRSLSNPKMKRTASNSSLLDSLLDVMSPDSAGPKKKRKEAQKKSLPPPAPVPNQVKPPLRDQCGHILPLSQEMMLAVEREVAFLMGRLVVPPTLSELSSFVRPPPPPPGSLIATIAEANALVLELKDFNLICLDCEWGGEPGNEKLALIQVADPSGRAWLLDVAQGPFFHLNFIYLLIFSLFMVL